MYPLDGSFRRKYVGHCKSRAADQLSVTRQRRLSAQTYSKQFTRPVSAPILATKCQNDQSQWQFHQGCTATPADLTVTLQEMQMAEHLAQRGQCIPGARSLGW